MVRTTYVPRTQALAVPLGAGDPAGPLVGAAAVEPVEPALFEPVEPALVGPDALAPEPVEVVAHPAVSINTTAPTGTAHFPIFITASLVH